VVGSSADLGVRRSAALISHWLYVQPPRESTGDLLKKTRPTSINAAHGCCLLRETCLERTSSFRKKQRRERARLRETRWEVERHQTILLGINQLFRLLQLQYIEIKTFRSSRSRHGLKSSEHASSHLLYSSYSPPPVGSLSARSFPRKYICLHLFGYSTCHMC
jgi:hypothetical protein